MSQAHIPQPDSAPQAPSEQFGSTEAAPTGPTVSGIGVPGPTPQEAQVHALAHNGVDPILYQQFIHHSNFTWSTSDQPGKLIWYMEITPKRFNKITARLATIYNIWTGGVNVNFKVAGTGFHAGALVVVRIPPNYHPSDFSGTFDFTAFEYIVIDPKQLEVASIHTGDQRPINYHYTNPEKEQPDSWDIGGYVAVFVQMALNTASTGTQQIQINAWTRLAPDFAFVQLRMPREITDIKTEFIPSSLLNILNFSGNIVHDVSTSMCLPSLLPVSTLRIMPSSLKVLLYGFAMTSDMDGNDNSDVWSGLLNFPFETTGTITTSTDLSFGGRYKVVSECSKLLLINDSHSVEPVQVVVDQAFYIEHSYKIKLHDALPSGWSAGNDVRAYPVDSVEGNARRDNSEYSLPTPESFVLFSASTGNYGNYGHTQTFPLSLFLASGQMAGWMPPNQAAVFNVIDVPLAVPIFQVKLNNKGVFSAVASDLAVSYLINRLAFEFVGFMPETDRLRPNPSYTMNQHIASSVHRRGLRAVKSN